MATGASGTRSAATARGFVCAIGALAGTPTWAAEPAPGPGQVTELEVIVVTATRMPMRSFEVPALVSVTDAATVQGLFQSRTLPDVLGELPGVAVQKTAYGQGSPYIRGYTGFRNVMLVEGIRLNNSVFRDGPNQYWNTVDSYSMGRVEVARGPASVLYGSDAVGGVVNVMSDLKARPDGFTPRGLYRYSSAENSNVARIEAGWNGDGLRALGGYTYKDFGDLEGGGDVGVQKKTGYDENAADVRIEYDLGDATTLIAGYQYVDQDEAWRTHRTIYGISWEGTTVGNDRVLYFDQHRQLGYLQLRHEGLGAIADALRASVSYHRQSEDQFRVRSNLRSDELGFDVYTTGLSAQLEKKLGVVQLVYGADWYHDEVSSYNVQYDADGSIRRVSAQGPVADDASYDLGGLFAQGEVPLGANFTATLAARYTWASVDADTVQDPQTAAVYSLEDDWDNFSASARLAYFPVVDGPWMLYAAVSQAFRAPNLSDLTRFDTALSGEVEVPSPSLDPETYLGWEIGAKFADERWAFQAAWFRTDGSDVIVRAPTGEVISGAPAVTKLNAADNWVMGIEGEASYRVRPSLRLFAQGSWLDGEGQAYPSGPNARPVDEPIDKLAPLAWRFGARWNLARPRLQIEALVEHADEQDKLTSRDKADTQRIPPGGTPSWTVLTLRSEWRATDRATLSLAIENLTDEDYRIHGSGVNEPGRNLIASVAVAW
jgi:hemoglobin/transferrin/lactoferrin receptor protein